ncbi:MAG: hypothetical protein LUH63_12425 [Parabacteroides sp.]|nr:hypothetical protein [Parabacteroides sp.]MCD8270910.1 hypothetical protein [Parabacteroides sp.]
MVTVVLYVMVGAAAQSRSVLTTTKKLSATTAKALVGSRLRYRLIGNRIMVKGPDNILIRGLSDQDREMLQTVMQETGCRQASKAVMKASYSFIRSAALIKRQGDRIRELEAENYILRRNAMQIIESTKKLDLVLSKTR